MLELEKKLSYYITLKLRECILEFRKQGIL